MSFLTRLFSKKPEEDYESTLASLASNIQKRQVQLSEIRLRERRTTLLVTLYAFISYAVYVFLWYLDFLPRSGKKIEILIKTSFAVVGPMFILFVRRIVQIWYQRKEDSEEKVLQNLLKQQRTKVEEIKKKTNYYSTRDLLQKYDEMALPHTPLRQRGLPPPVIRPQRATSSGIQTRSGLQQSVPPLTPSTSNRKQWYDKLADAILGDDDEASTPPTSRFALICEQCFAHNGLVKGSMWEDAQYVCPKCNHFNPSPRSRHQTTIIPVVSPGRVGQQDPQHDAASQQRVTPPSSDGADDAPVVDNAETELDM